MLLKLLDYVVLDVIEHRIYLHNMVPGVIEPCSLRFRCYEPVILGGFMVTTKPDGIGFV